MRMEKMISEHIFQSNLKNNNKTFEHCFEKIHLPFIIVYFTCAVFTNNTRFNYFREASFQDRTESFDFIIRIIHIILISFLGAITKLNLYPAPELLSTPGFFERLWKRTLPSTCASIEGFAK